MFRRPGTGHYLLALVWMVLAAHALTHAGLDALNEAWGHVAIEVLFATGFAAIAAADIRTARRRRAQPTT